jgi:Reverse transcriptase (RNA-dependent DNA polymerase)
MTDRAEYPSKRVASLRSLARALVESEEWLTKVAAKASEMYIAGKSIPKKDGSLRETFDTRPGLKRILSKINRVFLRRVIYPSYLHGALPKRDPKSAAEKHLRASVVASLDIKSFFPSITSRQVHSIWTGVFNFSPTVCDVMTNLTCCNGALVQGAPTSSYLANLVFWDVEPIVVEKLAQRGFRYTRYIDDISVSAVQNVTDKDLAWAIGQVYAMLGSRGFKGNRRKEDVMRQHKPIALLGLVVNSRAALSTAKRSQIRAEVHRQTATPQSDAETTKIDSTLGKVRFLRRFHPHEADGLLSRLSQK